MSAVRGIEAARMNVISHRACVKRTADTQRNVCLSQKLAHDSHLITGNHYINLLGAVFADVDMCTNRQKV